MTVPHDAVGTRGTDASPDAAGPARPALTLLAGLRVVLHVFFAALLAVGVARALADGGPSGGSPAVRGGSAALMAVLAVVLGAVYLAGTVRERRLWAEGRTPTPRQAASWLAALLACWGLLVLHHPDFTWVAFPLFFVVLHVGTVVLRRPALAVVAVAAVTGVVVAAAVLRGGAVAPGAVLGPAIGAGVAVVTFHAYRLLLVEAERQRALADALRATRAELAASERHAGVLAERERLAREIHDTLTQGLASIVLLSRAAQDAVRAGDAPLADARLETVRATAAENLAESRAFIRGLRSTARARDEADGMPARPGGDGAARPGAPAADDALAADLRAAVRGFRARQQALGTPVEAELEAVGEARPVPDAVATTLVRAVQASLANVAAHARARRCRVTLTWMDGEVAVDVADDGVGFRPDAVRARPAEGAGVGLPALRERVADVGGDVSVESSPGEGTVVAVRVPVPAGGPGAAPAGGADAARTEQTSPGAVPGEEDA